eukprot:7398937-Ditylum_brightwellii.AAC.1
MTMRFSGYSLETHRIQNKPIGEGYKFFCLASHTRYVVNCTPDGQTAAKLQNQEYKHSKEFGKIECMILHVLDIIETLKELQKNRIPKHATRGVGQRKEATMDTFCLRMDNYFTLPKVIGKLHDIGIGIVGTAQARRGWPPKELRNACCTVMDTGLVICVSTLHKVGEIVER